MNNLRRDARMSWDEFKKRNTLLSDTSIEQGDDEPVDGIVKSLKGEFNALLTVDDVAQGLFLKKNEQTGKNEKFTLSSQGVMGRAILDYYIFNILRNDVHNPYLIFERSHIFLEGFKKICEKYSFDDIEGMKALVLPDTFDSEKFLLKNELLELIVSFTHFVYKKEYTEKINNTISDFFKAQFHKEMLTGKTFLLSKVNADFENTYSFIGKRDEIIQGLKEDFFCMVSKYGDWFYVLSDKKEEFYFLLQSGEVSYDDLCHAINIYLKNNKRKVIGIEDIEISMDERVENICNFLKSSHD